MRPELAAQWALYTDWCASWGKEPIPATRNDVAAFLSAFPGTQKTQIRRIRAIRRQHEAAGYQVDFPQLAADPSTVWRNDDALATPREALRQMPRYGYPGGLRGRRDAFLIVLVGELHLTRAQAHHIMAANLEIPDGGGGVEIFGKVVGRDDQPDACPACAVTRWLRVVSAIDHGYRAVAMNLVDVTQKNETRHDCDVPLHDPTRPESDWREVGPLLLSLDTHGWTRPRVPLSTRSITAIITPRRIPTGRVEEPLFIRPMGNTRFEDASDAEITAAEADLDARLAAMLEQIKKIDSSLDGPLVDQ